ncbi:MAG TPA: hypothetical protein VIC32_07140 [Terriglobales bacterium]
MAAATVKMTFTVDAAIADRLWRMAVRMRQPQSAIVRDAICGRGERLPALRTKLAGGGGERWIPRLRCATMRRFGR